MARAIKEDEYAAKRNQILDMVQRLIYTQGYEQMTIQDVLDGLQMSKGAFYHYFRSKPALLEALVERTVDQIEQVLTPIVQDPHLDALEKLRQFFLLGGENAIVRQKVLTTALVRLGPLLAVIFHQGLREGVMNTPYPDEVGGLFFTAFQNIGEPFVKLALSPDPAPDRLARMQRMFGLYSDVLERMLGAPPGSLPIVDDAGLREWLEAPEAEAAPAGALVV